MAVLIEAMSVVIRADALLKKSSGGLDGFEEVVPSQTFCADGELVRVGFTTPQDVESFIHSLQRLGLDFMRSGKPIDFVVVDQMRGPTSQCDWLEFSHLNLRGDGPRVAACRLVGGSSKEIVTPPGWEYERSLSSSFGFFVQKNMPGS